MKLLIIPFLLLFNASFAQIDTLLLNENTSFSNNNAADFFVIINSDPFCNNDFSKVYKTRKGITTCTWKRFYTNQLDSIQILKYSSSQQITSYTSVLFTYVNHNKKDTLIKAIEYNYDTFGHMIKETHFDCSRFYYPGSFYKLVEKKQPIYNSFGKETSSRTYKEYDYINIPIENVAFEKPKLIFFQDESKRILIENGNGFFYGRNNKLPFESMLTPDSFYVNGNIVNGHMQGTWKGIRLDSSFYFSEQYTKSKLDSGMSYDLHGNNFRYNVAMTNCFFGTSDRDLIKFMHENIVYPAYERENDIQGRVLLKFIIDTSGLISNPSILKSPSSGFSKEALRVVNKMTNWKPAILRGQKISIECKFPINFVLN